MVIVVLRLTLTLRAIAFIIPNVPWWKSNYKHMDLPGRILSPPFLRRYCFQKPVVEAARSKDCFYLKGNILTCWFPFRPCLVREEAGIRQPAMWTSELSEGHTCTKLPHPQLCLPSFLLFLKLVHHMVTTPCSPMVFKLRGRQLQPQHKSHSGLLVHCLAFGSCAQKFPQ